MSPDLCPFCSLPPERVIRSTPLALAFYDLFPVAEGHALVIPRRHVRDYFELTPDELLQCSELLHGLRSDILSVDPSVTGFNIGANCGADAGQTVFHCHLHLIPRRVGDHPVPRGGVRAVIPGKASY